MQDANEEEPVLQCFSANINLAIKTEMYIYSWGIAEIFKL